MQRREFIALLGGMSLAAPRLARAETPTKGFRLAGVSPVGLVPDSIPNSKGLLGALNGLGYKHGENLIFEAPAKPPGPALAPEKIVEELKARKVDVIVAW